MSKTTALLLLTDVVRQGDQRRIAVAPKMLIKTRNIGLSNVHDSAIA
ncbi:MAG: hypothetical protein JSS06_01500 [Proteobacteria bacterium]|nr:hypothetical protein [Pseudomonadota bacterium]